MSPSEALARAVATADLREATRGLGPIGRWRVRRLLERAAIELVLALPTDPEDKQVDDRDPAGATVALLQTAWLRLHGIAMPPSLDLRAKTHERYWSEVSNRRGGARRWRPTVWLGISAAAVIAVVAVVAASSGGGDEAAITVREGPLELLAPEREATWVEALTDWVVALDRLARGRWERELPSRIAERKDDLARIQRDVLHEDLEAQLGEEVMTRLAAMLDAAEAATRARADWREREEEFAEAVRQLNRALFKRGLGYFFDSYGARYDDGRVETAFYTFRIASRRRYLAGEAPIEALHLRRLDRLNIVQFLLGYTSKHMDVAVLLVDKLEGEVSTRLGPALEPRREMPLNMNDEDEGKSTWLAVRAKAGQVVRESFYGAMPSEQQALSELGELLARRNDLVTDWNMRLEPKGISLREFKSLEVDGDYRDRFQALTSSEARGVLDDLQRRLETPEHRELFARLVARHARPVELHEVQHRIDYAEGDDFEVPPALLEVLHIPEDSDHADSEEVRRIAYELSAYTAELARDPEWARINLTLLCEHLYSGDGGAEGWSAVLILQGLAAGLGLETKPLIGAGGTGVDLETVGAIHLELLGRRGDELAQAAAALWQRWWGEPLVTLVPAP